MKFIKFLLPLLLSYCSVWGQSNLHCSDSSIFLKYPVFEFGNHVYYLSRYQDTLQNGVAVDNYYCTSTNKYTYSLEKRVLLLSDTAFNIYEDYQPAAVAFGINRITGKLIFFYVSDIIGNGIIGSTMLQYPKTISFQQRDSDLNITVPAKPVITFNVPGRYALWSNGFSVTSRNKTSTLVYEVRDSFISNFNAYRVADKFLTVDDTGKVLADEFIGWEPTGNSPLFPSHFTSGDIYQKDKNTYAVVTEFNDSISNGQKKLFILDSNLHLTDTFDYPPFSYNGTQLQGKLVTSFGGIRENYFFLPTGSLVRSAIGSYRDSADGMKEYLYYGVGKGNQSTGFRPTSVYFPPKSKTGDYMHCSNNAFYATVYNPADNRIYTFTSTQSDFNGFYCIDGQPNLGQLAVIDTMLQERWVKYIYARPGHCLQSFSISIPDGRKGVLVSGREYDLSDPDDISLWKPFIYYIDSNTKLGIDDSHSPIVITDQFILYPNPASDVVTIENILGGGFDYTIENILGQVKISGKTANSKTDIHISQLISGNYFVHIKSRGGQHLNIKFVVF